jgi:hypothetical protein
MEEIITISLPITQYLSIMIICLALPPTPPYPLANLPTLMELVITIGKNYLYSISPEIWQVVCDGVDFSDDDEQPTPDQLQKIHRNAQAISILTSSIDKKEFNSVDGLDVAKDVWTTLRMVHEGSKPMRKAKVEMLEGQLNCFIMYHDETSHEMFSRLKKLVNKERALGSKKWSHVDEKIHDGLHSNELQCCGLDPPRPYL